LKSVCTRSAVMSNASPDCTRKSRLRRVVVRRLAIN
jgi:hypothetical protein